MALILILSSDLITILYTPAIYKITERHTAHKIPGSTYSCYCVDGYTGVQCQTNWDECWSAPCENGGTCIDGIASYNCSCPEGFIGDNCETNFNECESNPCQNNGTCIDMTNGYLCSCIPGFAGDHCEVDIAVCNSSEEVRCYNGGQCIEGPGYKFYCKCPPGWAGKKCEDTVDECESNPCQNGGICIDAHADYMCACTFGFTGKSCEVTIEFCDSNSCSKNAICVVEDGLQVCYCVPDYHGDRCELQYDECLLGPGCMNGGTCIDGVDNFTCSCPPRLTGSLCECLILDDGAYDCKYVSPTPIPTTTMSVILTTMRQGWTSTELIPTGSEQYNDTTTQFITISQETESSSVLSNEVTEGREMDSTTDMTTFIEHETDTLLPEYQITGKTTDITSTMATTKLTTVTEVQVTDTSEVVTVTDCGETCIKSSTETIAKIPVPGEEVKTSTQSLDTSITDSTSATSINAPTEFSNVTSTSNDVSETEAHTIAGIDTTTLKLFTESPTEFSITDAITTPISTTGTFITEGLELDITTIVESPSTTVVPTECSDSVCNNHGNCINMPNGIQCQCAYNYGGRFCEEKISIVSAAFGGKSYIAHQLQNTTSINVEFNAKTLITDGQIMFVDIAKDVYMQLYMNSGLLKFKFSCGYQTMLLSELKTYVNKGFSMKIETRLDLNLKSQHCNATLRLNDTLGMSGGQVANITTLEHNATLYLGNTPNIHMKELENQPFVGCIKDLTVNGEKREIFGDSVQASEISECSSLSCLSGPCLNGGSCSDHENDYICSCANGWMGDNCEKSVCDHNPCQYGGSCIRHPGSGFLCLCPYGKHGIFCEYNVEITRSSIAPLATGISSYLIFPMSPLSMNSERFDLRLRFQANDMDQISLLAFVGQHGHHDSRSQHLALTFVKGYLMLTWNMGNGQCTRPRCGFESWR
ncbi:unnamed protein product [Plutella xylostella]|uniref:(diamondback moth) hypothetical protein n=1 Tax=Plutella xylostella TaxID=51655 RepID=A0A8S4DHM7_PLUXY|nr:unnamed protein product [Plutella xylostella]